MEHLLERLQTLVTELNRTNSSSDKVSKLKEFGDCRDILKYVYDTNIYQYGITADNIRKLSTNETVLSMMSSFNHETIYQLLNELSNRTITGHRAVAAVLSFINRYKPYENLILNIIDRNIEIRIGAQLINKVFPGLISEFNVSLGVSLDDYDPNRCKIDFKNNIFFASRKLDGVRTVAIIDGNGDITIKSRTGKEYLTLDLIKDQLRSLNLRNVILDGECCIVESNGNENFQSMMKEIRRKNHTISNPKYKCFDMIDLADFYSGTSKIAFSDRIQNLHRTLDGKLSNVDIVEQKLMTSWDDVDAFQQEALDNNWEGLILRKNDVYKGKRSNDLIKVKQFHECELTITGVEIGPFRVIKTAPDGRTYEETEQVVTNLISNYQGYPISIGSGLSIESRRLFKADQSLIVGKTVTVKYFETTKNADGGLSLRFPVLKTIHGLERTV